MADPPELSEDVALAPEHRRYVLDVFLRLYWLTHYELLGIAPGADKQTIKRAYFELARFVHPDRYFGKHLGSYKVKLDAKYDAKLLTTEAKVATLIQPDWKWYNARKEDIDARVTKILKG